MFIGSAVESNCYEFCIRNALSESSLMVFAPHCELHLYFIKKYIYIYSQHQPLVFTNTGKANVTKQYRWVLILYATEQCYLNSQKRHVSAHFYFQILSHWDFKVNPGGKLWVFQFTMQ